MERQGVIVRSSAVGAFMSKVYFWMVAGLIVTGVSAYYVAQNPALQRALFSGMTMIVFVVAMFAMVFVITAFIEKLPTSVSISLFTLYAVATGALLSGILVAYTATDIYAAFFTTAGTFALLSIYGMTTKRDLSGLGVFLFMALVGLLIATVVNIFLASTTLYWIVTYAGVLIFAGLTAYDTQMLRNMAYELEGQEELTMKYSIRGALSLYLDFINMFIYILRIIGNRK